MSDDVERVMLAIAEARVLWTAGKVETPEESALVQQHLALPSVRHTAEHIVASISKGTPNDRG